ncbi:M3 family oligoendopeptidase [Gudongella oleilytica]|uniref:M3 family oligoendopeptidase n=1 Tax=Gudongella oleilytica TaxID=1582259 RepID=UPI000FF8A3AE|nr:M3 family oligoendopeptidase [Gudongella oleilytica]
MKFKDYEYIRPDLDQMEKSFIELLEKFRNAKSASEQSMVIDEVTSLRNYFETMVTLASIRHSINTEDKFYETEQDFMDENGPRYEKLVTDYYKELINSPFRAELENEWGEQFFKLAELQIKTFSEEIMEELVKENKLSTEYDKLIASAQLDFMGEIRNLSQMRPFMESRDREVRRSAAMKVMSFFEENEKEFDRLYDELVKVRDSMAKKLGYPNYVPMGYARLSRTDYDAEMVANYRRQVYESLVPLSEELKERQRKRIGVERLTYYDEPLEYVTGNANPKGDPAWIIENGKKMYHEMSPETGAFIDFMTERELMDLEAKKGKRSGGYCTVIADYKSPFIFSNFNGTSGDIDVLTHEAGHAFQTFMSMDHKLPEYKFPTLEACEIHSMSMEFLAWPWMENFFKDEVEKYKFSHLAGALTFIPYGVAVDEFQHFVFENPNATPDERKSAWREIEKKYLPSKDYEDNDLLNRGGYWFRQGHIFSSPFYYIDYTLAQVCAFQFWVRSREDREKAWEDYLRLCKAGGSMSFLKLVELAELDNPFVDGTIERVVGPIKEYLDSVDDSTF